MIHIMKNNGKFKHIGKHKGTFTNKDIEKFEGEFMRDKRRGYSLKMKDEKMEEETKGLQCLRCYSVVFSINDMITHIIQNPSHQYWKYGDGKGVLFIKLLKDVRKE